MRAGAQAPALEDTVENKTSPAGNLLGCAMLLLLLAAPDMYAAYRDRICSDFRTVARIGSCDWLGSCSVVYIDGSVGELSKPYAGQPVCLATRWQWRKP